MHWPRTGHSKYQISPLAGIWPCVATIEGPLTGAPDQRALSRRGAVQAPVHRQFSTPHWPSRVLRALPRTAAILQRARRCQLAIGMANQGLGVLPSQSVHLAPETSPFNAGMGVFERCDRPGLTALPNAITDYNSAHQAPLRHCLASSAAVSAPRRPLESGASRPHAPAPNQLSYCHQLP